jgi:hypothetical protein
MAASTLRGARRRGSSPFFLGWQNQLEYVRFQLRKIGGGITAKALAQSPLLAAGLSCLPSLLPSLDMLGSECGGRVGVEAGGRCRNATDGAVQDEAWGSHLTPRGTTVMIPLRSEKLFQIIIGARQIRYARARKESGPGTAGDLLEVHQRRGQRPCGRLVSRHRAQESPGGAAARSRPHAALEC